ncbi:hypothetical protein EVAR_5111_1 [Eumeta japonica]|uniref:Uncharacterized protein n=1 Tax=Eumeta variegata TaxID=151549 RepID=A0A4C1SV38_EUMVA|nr:hypothetical protein EVAR_5111_1 [Eumeta japonica]
MKTDLKRGEPGTEQARPPNSTTPRTRMISNKNEFKITNELSLQLDVHFTHSITSSELYHNDLQPVTYGNFHPVTIPHNYLYPVTYGNLHPVTIPITHNTTSIRSRMATSIRSTIPITSIRSTIPITSIQLSSSHETSIRLQASIRLHKAMQN